MIVDGKNIETGSIIQFNVVNGKDPGTKAGVVIAECGYKVARVYGDIVRYHQEVNESLGGSPITTPLEELEFFVIETESGITEAIATDWVAVSSLVINDVENDILIKIYNKPNSEIDTILTILRDNGYVANVVES